MATPNDDYDFGFSFADEEEVATTATPAVSNDDIAALQAKIDTLLDTQEKALQNAMSAAN